MKSNRPGRQTLDRDKCLAVGGAYVNGRWKQQVKSRQQQTSHSQRFLILFFSFDGTCQRPLVLPLALSRALSPRLLVTSKITTRKTYVKDRMTSTQERTPTERHVEFNTNTMCRCTRLHSELCKTSEQMAALRWFPLIVVIISLAYVGYTPFALPPPPPPHPSLV